MAAAQISARLDRLPASSVIWSWVARISFGAFFEIYETALTSLLAPMLVRAGIFKSGRGGLFGLPDLATFAFGTFAGLFVGVLIFSAISDRYGRRSIFTLALLWYAAATLVMAGQHDALSICLWRFTAAIGIGAEIVAVDAYLAELTPKALRGRGFAISKAIQYAAVPIAGLLAVLLAKRAIGGLDGWRVMLLVPAIGAVLIWWVRRGLPESPRWLALHGRTVEADKIVGDVEAAMRLSGKVLPEPEPPRPFSDSSVSYASLFQRPLRRRVLMMMVASCCSVVAFYGFSNWLPSLLEAKGVELTKSLAYTALIALAFPLTPLAMTFIADRFERKWQIVAGSSLVVVSGLAFAVQATALGWITFGLLVGVGNNLQSYAMHTYRSELFPTGVRARAIGVIYAADRLTAAFNSYLIAFILVYGGPTSVLVFLVMASVPQVALIALLGPRTRGLSSEEVINTRAEGVGLGPLQAEV